MTGFIDFTSTEQYVLSIRLSADGFSFSVHSPLGIRNGFRFTSYPTNASCSLAANVKEMLAQAEELRHAYKQMNILYDTPRFTLVPFDLFEDELTETVFYQNFQKTDNETVLCNVLSKNNVVVLFGMDKHVRELLAERFPEARIFCGISPEAEYLAPQSRTENNRKLYAHIREERMEVFCYDRGRLLLANTYPCSRTADRAYYLLYAWHQLNYDQEKDELYLTGQSAGRDELQQELCTFLRHVSVIQPSTAFNQPEKTDEPARIPFDMQALLLCE